jgi:hypothetical protein
VGLHHLRAFGYVVAVGLQAPSCCLGSPTLEYPMCRQHRGSTYVGEQGHFAARPSSGVSSA